jgi:hypothetical protein
VAATILRPVVAFAQAHARGPVFIRWSCLALVGIVSLAAPAPADAHLKGGEMSTNFVARVGSLRPAISGIAARVLDGDLRLELRVAPARVVIVLGFLREPFLRFSPAGVEANLASPTAGSARVIGTADAVASPGVHWRLIRRGHVFAWHDNRLRPVATVPQGSQQPRAVGSWTIPLIVDGRATTLSGTEWFASGPSPWPWLAPGALFVALAFLAGRRVPPRAQRLIASALLPVAVAGLSAAWSGAILVGRATLPAELFAVGFAAVSAVFLCLGVAAAQGEKQLGVMALIGAFAATFALPLITLFEHGFVLSALPGTVARFSAAAAFVCGLSAAAVCAPAVKALLSSEGPAGRGVASLQGGR